MQTITIVEMNNISTSPPVQLFQFNRFIKYIRFKKRQIA